MALALRSGGEHRSCTTASRMNGALP